MLSGIGISEGIGIGKAYVVRNETAQYSRLSLISAAEELSRYKAAAAIFCDVTNQMALALKSSTDQSNADILAAQIMIVQDESFEDAVGYKISEGFTAEAALESAADYYIELFNESDDELIRQRAADIIDLKNRLTDILLNRKDTGLFFLPNACILVVDELLPSMLTAVKKADVHAIVTRNGGKSSHAAILARALGIPAVSGIEGLFEIINDGEQMVVDGSLGRVYENADEQTIAEYIRRSAAMHIEDEELRHFLKPETYTRDMQKMYIYSNIAGYDEAVHACSVKAEGIGLLRTEGLFMNRYEAPDEEEQYEQYKSIADLMSGAPIVIRTLDIGGDKPVGCLKLPVDEANPFLGFRAIRYCLADKDVFKTQIRAILRAGAGRSGLRIMIPFITCVDEVKAAKAMIEEAKTELAEEKIPYAADIKVGIMAETPAAVFNIDLLGRYVDFFSIGTNDLVQYVMAADRGNINVSGLYSFYQPAVLRAIKAIISAGEKCGCEVEMCGEAAADLKLVPVLLGFGLKKFSVTSAFVLRVRREIARWDMHTAEEISEQVMSLETEQEVSTFLESMSMR